MKKICILTFLLCLALHPVYSQKSKQLTDYDLAREVYKKAISYNDLVAARNAVYELMILKPEETSWNDTLVILMFSSGMYTQSIDLGRNILETHKDNQLIMEIVCISEENTGLIKEALADYEKLYALSSKPLHQYKIATLQYALQRHGECNQTLNQLISNQATANDKIYISIGQGQGQEVNLLAAAWNVAGMVSLETGQEENARKFFAKALEIDPSFSLPKNNLAYLDSNKK